MQCNAIIPDRSVVLDGEGRFCPDLTAPDEGAQSYSWDGEAGFIQFDPRTGKPMEWFFDEARMDPFVAAWEANPPAAPVLPAATVMVLDPSSAKIGDPDITLRVIGKGFTASTVILFNNGEETTVFVSQNEVTTIVKPSLASGPWTVPVGVKDGAALSNTLDFAFTEPEASP